MKINKLERKLRKAMVEASKKHIGKKKVTQNNKPWLTEEIKESIKNRNQLRKTVHNNREEWITACKNTSNMIADRKKNSGTNMLVVLLGLQIQHRSGEQSEPWMEEDLQVKIMKSFRLETRLWWKTKIRLRNSPKPTEALLNSLLKKKTER